MVRIVNNNNKQKFCQLNNFLDNSLSHHKNKVECHFVIIIIIVVVVQNDNVNYIIIVIIIIIVSHPIITEIVIIIILYSKSFKSKQIKSNTNYQMATFKIPKKSEEKIEETNKKH